MEEDPEGREVQVTVPAGAGGVGGVRLVEEEGRAMMGRVKRGVGVGVAIMVMLSRFRFLVVLGRNLELRSNLSSVRDQNLGWGNLCLGFRVWHLMPG